MKKLIISFFILFIFITLGCTQVSNTSNGEDNTTTLPSVFSSSLSLSKEKEAGSVVFNPGEQVTARLSFENRGAFPANNIRATLYGCDLDINSPNDGGETYEFDFVNPQDQRILAWQIIAPDNFAGQCTLYGRICFDYKTEAYKSIELARQDISLSSAGSVEYVSEGPVDVDFDFSDNYIVYTDYSSVTLEFDFVNIGDGKFQYIGKSDKTDHLDRINMTVNDVDGILLGGDLSEWGMVTHPFDSNNESFYSGKKAYMGIPELSDFFTERAAGSLTIDPTVVNVSYIFDKPVYDEIIEPNMGYGSDNAVSDNFAEFEEYMNDPFGYYNFVINQGDLWMVMNSFNTSGKIPEDDKHPIFDKTTYYPSRGELKFVNRELSKKVNFYVNKSKLPEESTTTLNVATDIAYTYCIPAGSVKIKSAS